jgi:hypothetical protein
VDSSQELGEMEVELEEVTVISGENLATRRIMFVFTVKTQMIIYHL